MQKVITRIEVKVNPPQWEPKLKETGNPPQWETKLKETDNSGSMYCQC